MEVNVHHAKTHLSRLIEQAENGEGVIIIRNGKPAVRLVPIPKTGKRPLLGALKGKFTISEDFHQPDKELEDLMLNGPLFPDETDEKTS